MSAQEQSSYDPSFDALEGAVVYHNGDDSSQRMRTYENMSIRAIDEAEDQRAQVEAIRAWEEKRKTGGTLRQLLGRLGARHS